MSVIIPTRILTCLTGNVIFSNTLHYAVYTCTIGSCMPSRRLRWLDVPLLALCQSGHSSYHLSLVATGLKIDRPVLLEAIQFWLTTPDPTPCATVEVKAEYLLCLGRPPLPLPVTSHTRHHCSLAEGAYMYMGKRKEHIRSRHLRECTQYSFCL